MNLLRRIYTERRSVVVPLLVVLAANVGVLALGVVPLRHSVDSDQGAAADAKTALAAAQLQNVRAKDERLSRERAQQELKKFYGEILPTSLSGAVSVTTFWLHRTAADAGVSAKNSQFEPEEVRDSQLRRVKGKVTLTGDYSSIRRFLYDVETAQEFVIIDKVEVAESGQLQGNSPLEVTLDISTYYLAGGLQGQGGR